MNKFAPFGSKRLFFLLLFVFFTRMSRLVCRYPNHRHEKRVGVTSLPCLKSLKSRAHLTESRLVQWAEHAGGMRGCMQARSATLGRTRENQNRKTQKKIDHRIGREKGGLPRFSAFISYKSAPVCDP